MELRHALLAADRKYEQQKIMWRREIDLDEDAVVEHEEACNRALEEEVC
jgi:hypothetical protein